MTADHTTRLWSDETGSAVVTVDPVDITGQSGLVTLRLTNLTAGTSSTLAMACPAVSPVSISIAAVPTDEVAIEACTGNQVLACSDTPIDLGMAGVQPIDLDGATVTGMWRSGPTVLVGTDTGVARVISLDDPWQAVVLPWQLPLPHNAPSGVIGRGPSTVAYADGSHLLLWNATTGIVSDLEPLGVGVPIDLALVRGSNAIIAGHDTSGIVVATSCLRRRAVWGPLSRRHRAHAVLDRRPQSTRAATPFQRTCRRAHRRPQSAGSDLRRRRTERARLGRSTCSGGLRCPCAVCVARRRLADRLRRRQPGLPVPDAAAWYGRGMDGRAHASSRLLVGPDSTNPGPALCGPLRFRPADFWLFGREAHRVRWLSEDRRSNRTGSRRRSRRDPSDPSRRDLFGRLPGPLEAPRKG